MGFIGNFSIGYIINLEVTPSIVYIFYHNQTGTVKYGNNITLSVLSVEVGRIIILNCKYARMVVEEFKSVALLDEVPVRSKKPDRRSGLEKFCLIFK
jgi:hypothetical protein